MKDIFRGFAKARGRPLSHILRGICVIVWPLSLAMRLYYRLRFCSRWYDFLNRKAERKFKTEPVCLDEEEQTVVKTLAMAP